MRGRPPGRGDSTTSGQVTSSGLSLGSKDGGWRVGAVLEHGAVAGGAAGAFDDGSRHVLTFANYAKRTRFGDAADAGKGGSVAVSTTLAGGLMRSDGILQEAKGLYSQHHVALAHTGDRHRTQLRIEQPLRAESGRANFKRPVGRTVAGRWIYDTARIGLRPEARAVRIGAQHERELGTGKIAFGASYTADAGHRPGEDDAAIGAQYELRWWGNRPRSARLSLFMVQYELRWQGPAPCRACPDAPPVGFARRRPLSGLPGGAPCRACPDAHLVGLARTRAARPRKPWIRKLREPWPGAMESVEFDSAAFGSFRSTPATRKCSPSPSLPLMFSRDRSSSSGVTAPALTACSRLLTPADDRKNTRAICVVGRVSRW